MNNLEFKSEFQETYESASKGAPDLNNYEISLWLTQAIRDLVDELYPKFELTEYSKRALNPLIREKSLSLSESTDFFSNVLVTEAPLPSDVYYILQENVILAGQTIPVVEIISEDLDYINKSLKNPFRKPSKRKILRTQIGSGKVRLYSDSKVKNYKIKYLKKYSPIILSDFASDSDLLGTETIDGLNTITTTELPIFLHHKIVERAVVLATKALRQNNLQTQIEV